MSIMDRKTVIDKAIAFFSLREYHLQTQTDNLLVFQTEKREVNWSIVGVLCCLGLIPAIIYYYVITKKLNVTVSISGEKDATVTVSGNTIKAKKDADEFKRVLG